MGRDQKPWGSLPTIPMQTSTKPAKKATMSTTSTSMAIRPPARTGQETSPELLFTGAPSGALDKGARSPSPVDPAEATDTGGPIDP